MLFSVVQKTRIFTLRRTMMSTMRKNESLYFCMPYVRSLSRSFLFEYSSRVLLQWLRKKHGVCSSWFRVDIFLVPLLQCWRCSVVDVRAKLYRGHCCWVSVLRQWWFRVKRVGWFQGLRRGELMPRRCRAARVQHHRAQSTLEKEIFSVSSYRVHHILGRRVRRSGPAAVCRFLCVCSVSQIVVNLVY